MKKILLIIAVCIGFSLPLAMNIPLATAEVETTTTETKTVTDAPVEKFNAEEKKQIAALKTKISEIKNKEEKTLADTILKKITGEIGKGVSNPTKRIAYYAQLTKILAMPDANKRVAALKNFGKKPSDEEEDTDEEDEDTDDDTNDNSSETKAEEEARLREEARAEAIKEQRTQCLQSGGTWSNQSNRCAGGQGNNSIVGGSGQGSGGGSGSGSGQGSGGGSSGGGSSGGGGMPSMGGGSGGGDSGGGGSGGGSSSSGGGGPTSTGNTNNSWDGSKGVSGSCANAVRSCNSKITITYFGFPTDPNWDTNSNCICKGSACASTCGIGKPCGKGNRDNLLKPNNPNGSGGGSVSLSPELASSCGLKKGDTVCLSNGVCAIYEDQTAGGLKGTRFDMYRPDLNQNTVKSGSLPTNGGNTLCVLGKNVPKIPHPIKDKAGMRENCEPKP